MTETKTNNRIESITSSLPEQPLPSTAESDMLTRILPIFALLLATGQAFASPHNAVVRISNGNGMGSGCVFRQDANHFWILTNAHVAGSRRGNRVSVEFWKAGRLSNPIRGVVAAAWMTNSHRDIAFVAVKRSDLGSIAPDVIPLAGPDDAVNFRHFSSCGCPSGVWANEFHGHAFSASQSSGDVVMFYPAPAPGRSGSAFFDASGTKIIGLLAWRSDGGSGDGRKASGGYGIAMTHREIWAAWRGETTAQEPRPPYHKPAALLTALQVGDVVKVTATQASDGRIVVRDAEIVWFEGDDKLRVRDRITGVEWMTPAEFVQCPDGRCFPWNRPQPQPQPSPGNGRNDPWPDLPPDLSGGSPQAPSQPQQDWVLRSEMELAFQQLRSELDSAKGQASIASQGVATVQGDVTAVRVEQAGIKAEQAGLKEKIGGLAGKVIESERLREELGTLKDDFLERLKNHEGGLSPSEIRNIAKETIGERIGEIKGGIGQKSDESGGMLPWLLGVGVSLGLTGLGFGTWQTFAIKKALQVGLRRVQARRGGRADDTFPDDE